MKEIRMDYSEYEQMKKVIEEQERVIEEFKNDSRAVVIRFRTVGLHNLNGSYILDLPIVTTDTEKEKEFLSREYERIAKKIQMHNDEVYHLRKEIEKRDKLPWYKKLFK